MVKIINFFKGNALLKGSAVVLFGSTIASLGSYLFHLLMGRFLGPVDYGVLESLISITYFLGIANVILSLFLVKFISKEKDPKKISLFVKKVSSKVGVWGFLALIVFLAGFPLFKNLIKVPLFSFFIGIGIISYLSVFVGVFTSIFQGTMKFNYFSFYNIFNSWSKLIISLFFVFLGMKVGGAISASIVASFLSIILGLSLIKKYLPFSITGEINIQSSFVNMKEYLWALLFSNISLTSLFTVDIILARYFLSPVSAGFYACLSVLGKIIFFASSPVSQVMFPMISEKQFKKENYLNIFWSSFIIILLISVFISLIYFAFPDLMIGMLFGSKFLEASSGLGYFAIFLSLYSLCNLLVNFFLSVSKTKIVFFLPIFALLQVIFICLRHQTINEIIQANILTLILLLFFLLIYYLKTIRFNDAT